MVKAKLIALMLLMATVTVAQEKVNHLIYKSTNTVESKKGKEVTVGIGTEVNINDRQVVITRLKEDGTLYEALGNRIYDRKNGVVIYDNYKSKLYLVETFDSITGPVQKAKDLGKTATINGYNCKAYGYSYTWKVDYKTVSKTNVVGVYDYVVWITQDIVTDEASQDQVLSSLTNNFARFDYKGTIVKLEYTFTTGNGKRSADVVTELTKANTSDKADKLAEMPWKRDDVKAMLPSEDAFGTSYTYTAESDFRIAFKRMRELLTKITGIEKPKWIGVALPRPMF